MIRFSAKYSATIDEKGRVVLPSFFKKMMGTQAENPLVIEKDIYSRCLNIYPENHWNEQVREIESKLNPFNKADIELLEQFYENFTTVRMAANGRINIPTEFIKHSKIEKEVVLIGMGKMIKLWDAAEYEIRKAKRKPLREMYEQKLGNRSGTETE
jgi:MraZ protein